VNEGALRDEVWRKSSYSADSGACVEIARRSPQVLAVRDSMDTGGPRLFFTLAEWKTFTCQLKNVGFGGE
jgi:Domain of unknown function (DUF397)